MNLKFFLSAGLALFLIGASNSPIGPVTIADPATAQEIVIPGYPSVFFIDIPNPEHKGHYILQESSDAGASWHLVYDTYINDPDTAPVVRAFINPTFGPPFVWYRYVRVLGRRALL